MAWQLASGFRHGISINNMQLCSWSVAHARPYHNPTATMGLSVQNVDISKLLTPTKRHTHLPSTVETWIHLWWAHFSNLPVDIEGEHCPNEVIYDAGLRSGQDSGEYDEHTDEFPWDGFWQFVQKWFTCANPQFYLLFGWLVSCLYYH
jgi:hypothetical protein